MIKILLELKLLALAIFVCHSLVGMEPKEESDFNIPPSVQIEQEIRNNSEYQKWILEIQKEQQRIYNANARLIGA